ncbi:MAG TPA: hypothetical protein VKX17_20940 [Planctomycetota bacterium]|nr:hypothetical protein [Planctomycetota bacterium]
MHTTTMDWSIEDVIKSLPKDPDKLLACKLPPELQRRASELPAMSKSGEMDADSKEELERMLRLESRVVGLKAKALRAKRLGK